MQTETLLAKYLPVIAILLISVVLLSLVNSLTEDRISENKRQRLMAMMSAVLPATATENTRGEMMELEEPELAGDGKILFVYKQWTNDQADGISLFPVNARGYSGRITLTVGITPDGSISGVRVMEQKETAGLGDLVHQSKSGWLDQFRGLSLATMQAKDWAVKNEGGSFDALSGATITSRGVINAVRKTAEIYAISKETSYSLQ